MTGQEEQPEIVFITREELTGHIDDPLCTCSGCTPEWHTGILCNCRVCLMERLGELS